MNRWYRKTVVKVITVIVGIVSGAAFVASLLSSLSLAGTANPSDIRTMLEQEYEDSEDFNTAVENSMYDILNHISLKEMFETEGAYNLDKLVDVIDYSRNRRITGDNISGVAYTLEELKSWSEDFAMWGEPYGADDGQLYDNNKVIVCEKTDGSYYYYYTDDFLALFEQGKLELVIENDGKAEMTQEEYLEEIIAGTMTSSGFYGASVVDSDGHELYTSFWNFGRSLKERYAPEGASNLLEIVNKTPSLNGKLSVIYDDMAYVLNSLNIEINIYESGWEYLDEGNTNLTYIYANRDTKKVSTNNSEYSNYNELKENIKKMKSGDSVRYMIVYPQLKDFDTNMNISESSEWDTVRSFENDKRVNSVIAVAVNTDYPVSDQFYEGHMSYGANVPVLRGSLRAMLIFGILFLISLVWTAMTAGRRPEDDEIHLTAFDRCKTELAAVIIVAVWIGVIILLYYLAMGIFVNVFQYEGWDMPELSYYSDVVLSGTESYTYSALTGSSLRFYDVLFIFFFSAYTFGCFFAGYTSLVRRIKAKVLWKGSLLYAALTLRNEVSRAMAVPLRAGLLLAAFLACQWAAILWRNTPLILLAFAADASAVWFVLSRAVAKSRIKKGIEEIASGNMSYQIPVEGIRGGDRELAEKVNDIGSGLNRAVEEAMRNERLKTDLITNVSHDIKTPLTSIINYVDILKRENIQDKRIQGYLDILESKAHRLKILTEDVVEASKVSSGNISLELMDVNFTEMIQQTEGEFAEKFAARNLEVVLSIPEEPAVIHVDGRRMWRVLENIFSNAVKYAMSGTRVYADLRFEENTVKFSLKNISEQQLNISADELTERFIRGDLSRGTEGSGLGLSIAKSLTVMQGGEFELYLDGDLFRVNISFPRVNSEKAEKDAE